LINQLESRLISNLEIAAARASKTGLPPAQPD
jgi:hypothetical protein